MPTLKEILNLNPKQISQLTDKDLREALTLMERYSRKRVNSLFNRGKFSYAAYKSFGIITTDEDWDTKFPKTEYRDKNRRWMEAEFRSYWDFLNAKTSTVTGVKDFERKQDIAIFGKTREKGRTVPLHRMTDSERRRFWDLYNEFIKNKGQATLIWGSSSQVMNSFYETMTQGNYGSLQELFDLAERRLKEREAELFNMDGIANGTDIGGHR